MAPILQVMSVLHAQPTAQSVRLQHTAVFALFPTLFTFRVLLLLHVYRVVLMVLLEPSIQHLLNMTVNLVPIIV